MVNTTAKTTIRLSDDSPAEGPLTYEQTLLLKELNESSDPASLRTRLSFIRSRFWKAVTDLKGLHRVIVSNS